MTSPTGSGSAAIGAHAVGHRLHAPLVERQAIEQRGVEPARPAGLHVAGVGLEDLRRPRLERVGDRVQRGVLGAGGQRGERPRRVAGGQAQLGDRARSGGGGGDRGAVVAMPLLHQHPAARAARAPARSVWRDYKRTSTLYR